MLFAFMHSNFLRLVRINVLAWGGGGSEEGEGVRGLSSFCSSVPHSQIPFSSRSHYAFSWSMTHLCNISRNPDYKEMYQFRRNLCLPKKKIASKFKAMFNLKRVVGNQSWFDLGYSQKKPKFVFGFLYIVCAAACVCVPWCMQCLCACVLSFFSCSAVCILQMFKPSCFLLLEVGFLNTHLPVSVFGF